MITAELISLPIFTGTIIGRNYKNPLFYCYREGIRREPQIENVDGVIIVKEDVFGGVGILHEVETLPNFINKNVSSDTDIDYGVAYERYLKSFDVRCPSLWDDNSGIKTQYQLENNEMILGLFGETSSKYYIYVSKDIDAKSYPTLADYFGVESGKVSMRFIGLPITFVYGFGKSGSRRIVSKGNDILARVIVEINRTLPDGTVVDNKYSNYMRDIVVSSGFHERNTWLKDINIRDSNRYNPLGDDAYVYSPIKLIGKETLLENKRKIYNFNAVVKISDIDSSVNTINYRTDIGFGGIFLPGSFKINRLLFSTEAEVVAKIKVGDESNDYIHIPKGLQDFHVDNQYIEVFGSRNNGIHVSSLMPVIKSCDVLVYPRKIDNPSVDIQTLYPDFEKTTINGSGYVSLPDDENDVTMIFLNVQDIRAIVSYGLETQNIVYWQNDGIQNIVNISYIDGIGHVLPLTNATNISESKLGIIL